MTKQQQIDTLQKQLDAANEQLATVDNALKEQYLNIATNIISEIKSWFKDRCYNSIVLCYKDVYNYLDDFRKNVENNAPEFTPSVLCELSMALSEMRRQVAEQRIVITRQEKTIKSLKYKLNHLGERICRTKDALNAIHGVKCSGKLPKTPAMQYGDEVVDYALRQEQVKQAKIEVLNELKDMLNDKPNGWSYIIYIDDMIKELKDGKDKS